MVAFNGYDYPTFQVRNRVIQNELPKVEKSESPVLFSLFRKNVNTDKWERIRTTAFPEKIALRIWGTEAICNPNSLSIRPVRVMSMAANVRYSGKVK